MNKKTIVVPIIVGASLLVVGGLIAGITLAATGSFASLSTCEPYVERIVEVTSETVDIVVNDDNNKIVIASSTTASTVSISVFENVNEYYVATEDETTFTLDYEDDIPWNIRFFYFPLTDRTMTITIPQNYDGSLIITTTNSAIEVDGISLAGELSLESINGYVSIDDVTIAQDVSVYTTNSAIYLDNVATSSDVSVRSLNGLIRLNEVSSANVTAQTTNGKIDVSDVIVATKLDLNTTNGAVLIGGIDVGEEIRLTTTNGAVSGNVEGPSSDYDVDSQTTNGTNNLAGYNSQTPSTDDKLLYVRAFNGAINITFR